MDKSLAHHGIKGMHWGIRRYRNKDGSLTPAGKARAAKQETRRMDKEKRTDMLSAARHVHSLSDEELAKRIGRLEKEEKLLRLTASNSRTMLTGNSALRGMLYDSGQKALSAAIVGGAVFFGKAFITGDFSGFPKEAATYMFPNPNKKK